MAGTINKTKDIRAFALFFIGWLIYFTQGALRIHGRFTTLLLIVMLLLSFIYFFQLVAHNRLNSVLRALSYLLVMFVVYGIVDLFSNHSAISDDVLDFEYIKKATISIVPIFGFYYLLRRVNINDKWFVVILIFFLLSAIGEFFSSRWEMEQKIAEGLIRDRDTKEMVVGAVYRFLPILPLLFYVKNPWVKYSILFVVLVFAVMGLKRGPLLLCAVSLFVLILDELKQMRKRVSVVQIVVLIMAIVGGYYAITRLIAANDFLVFRFEAMLEGDSSNRDTIYEDVYYQFVNEQNVFLKLFGHGADSTLRIVGAYAHNDWLEIALNQGVLGVLLYFLYYFNFLKQWRKTNKNHDVHMCIGLFLILTLVTSYLSMSINNNRIAAQFCIAYSLVLAERSSLKKIY